MKLNFVILLFLFSHFSFASKIDLKDKSLQYIKFMQQVGNCVNEDLYIKLIPNLFSDNLQKIENGKLLLSSSNGLIDQLKQVRNIAFPWEMQLLDLLVDESAQATTIRFVFTISNKMQYTTMAILKFNQNGQITEINEVYNKYLAEK